MPKKLGQYRNPLNLSLYRLKADCYRRLKMSPEGTVKIIFKGEDGNDVILTDPQEIPSGDILLGMFPESAYVIGTIYFNEQPIKSVKFLLEEDEEEEEKPIEKNNNNQPTQFSNQFEFTRQLMEQQNLLNELKFKSFQEITEIKLNGMKVQFEEMLSQKEKIYLEKLEIEREKVKLESGLETESLLMETFRNLLDELTPHIGNIAQAYLSNKTIPQIQKVTKRI